MMKILLKSVSLLLVTLSLSSQATDLILTTDKGYQLKADYYKSQVKSDRGVLMLHQCNYNRSMYNDIGQQLADKGIHALSLDFRGFAESASSEFDVEKVQALPREKRSEAWQAMSAYWPSDVQLAYNHLKSKMTDDGIVGIIGASCGGSQAITLAEKNPISAISFFSSGQREENIQRYKKMLANKPTLIIAAEEDTGTYTSGKKLFDIAKHANSKFIAYKGPDHGYPLLDKDAQLATTIVAWFDSQLTK
jgi:dienelactone hydrolase